MQIEFTIQVQISLNTNRLEHELTVELRVQPFG